MYLSIESPRNAMGGMDWIDLAHVRVRLRTPVNAVMNLWVP